MPGLVVGLCYGGGEGGYEEGYQAELLCREAGARVVYLACNEAGIQLPRLHHWATHHPARLPEWARRRAAAGRPGGYVRWAGEDHRELVDRSVRTPGWHRGSSGLLLLDVALNALGLERAILCGIPMDDRRNAFRGRPWSAAAGMFAVWRGCVNQMRGRARSMSGNTRELLGAPTLEWLGA